MGGDFYLREKKKRLSTPGGRGAISLGGKKRGYWSSYGKESLLKRGEAMLWQQEITSQRGGYRQECFGTGENDSQRGEKGRRFSAGRGEERDVMSPQKGLPRFREEKRRSLRGRKNLTGKRGRPPFQAGKFFFWIKKRSSSCKRDKGSPSLPSSKGKDVRGKGGKVAFLGGSSRITCGKGLPLKERSRDKGKTQKGTLPMREE